MAYTMRSAIENRLVPDDSSPEYEVVCLALSGLGVQRVADAFFAMCRELGGFSDAEKRIEKSLRLRVDGEIRRRNIFAHADWFPAGALPPAMLRTKASSVDEPVRSHEPTVAELEDHGVEVEILTHLLYDFGHTAAVMWDVDPKSIPSVDRLLNLADRRVVHRRISNHPLGRNWSWWRPGVHG